MSDQTYFVHLNVRVKDNLNVVEYWGSVRSAEYGHRLFRARLFDGKVVVVTTDTQISAPEKAAVTREIKRAEKRPAIDHTKRAEALY